jgi:DNA polymerase elongation subunit (family B)
MESSICTKNVNESQLSNKKDSTGSDIEFQILDWNYHHDENDEGKKYFKVRLYGRTRDNKTIYAEVDKYKPFFFIEIKKAWRLNMIQFLMEEVKKKVWPKENADGLRSFTPVEKYKFWGFTNYTKFNYLQLVFDDYDSMKSYEKVFRKKLTIRQLAPKPFKLQLYESNIEPILRCMHIRKLDAVGWVKIPAGEYKTFKPNPDPTCCEINIKTPWTSLNRVEDRTIMPFVILAFDLECTSGDGSFPQAIRDDDKIIQIGCTFSRFGETECFYQHIITLGTCDPLDGITVEPCKTESEVLLAFTRLVRKMNPDIITGYNIFGFDFEYIKDRSKKLGIYHKFSKLSRMNEEESQWKEQKLASSALGENILKYYDMGGRVVVDLMKVIQRDHKLASYKLDYAASYFIREEVSKLHRDEDANQTTIYTDSVYGLKEEQYVTIYYNDGITENAHMDGKKFQVIELHPKKLVVEGLIDDDIMSLNYEVFWCQAKDDITPNDIFRMQKGSSKDRSIVAKYCIQDCVLCNKLMAKLDVITNNVGMANVCNVPLSYLFMRGQGVKIFSLVAKKCREKNHLIPVIRKKFKTDEEKAKEEEEAKNEELFEKFINDLNNKGKEGDEDDDDDDDGYEGAIVFPPVKGVHFEPVTVLDYASLYPRSMIYRNLSHEYCVIDDEKYGNLPGYKYNLIHYMTCKIVDELPIGISRDRKKEMLAKYKEQDVIIEEITTDPTKLKTNIYDKDKEGKKRYLITELIIDNTTFKLFKYATSKFAEKLDGTKGIIPEILQDLLDARTKYKNEMKTEKDPFKQKILDGLQQAYKVTANSLYGQTGASTSAVCMKEIAASTTATGREMLIFSKNFIEFIYKTLINLALGNKVDMLEIFNNYVKTDNHMKSELFLEKYYDIFKKFSTKKNITYDEFANEIFQFTPLDKFKKPKQGFTNKEELVKIFKIKMTELLTGYAVNQSIIYGDTDSVFFKNGIVDAETGAVLEGKEALKKAIQLGIWASITICLLLPDCQEQQYEKVLWPFMILTKKRYVGNLYETNPDEFYQKSMGIVLKRRDNAQIVKIVCGGIIHEILNNRSKEGAIEFTKKILKQILSGKYPIEKFIITKTLKHKDSYKDYTRIVHAVLAERMYERDPGNAPQSNDRIPYAFVETKGKIKLQGERVEHPEYIIKNKLRLDYLFYITNQIMKPAIQFLELFTDNPTALFEGYIIREQNRRKGMKPINYYFNEKEELNKPDTNNDEEEDDDDEDNEVMTMDELETIYLENKLDDDTINMNSDDDSDEIKPIVKKTKNKTKVTVKAPKAKTKKIKGDGVRPESPTVDENGNFIM